MQSQMLKDIEARFSSDLITDQYENYYRKMLEQGTTMSHEIFEQAKPILKRFKIKVLRLISLADQYVITSCNDLYMMLILPPVQRLTK